MDQQESGCFARCALEPCYLARHKRWMRYHQDLICHHFSLFIDLSCPRLSRGTRARFTTETSGVVVCLHRQTTDECPLRLPLLLLDLARLIASKRHPDRMRCSRCLGSSTPRGRSRIAETNAESKRHERQQREQGKRKAPGVADRPRSATNRRQFRLLPNLVLGNGFERYLQ